MRVLRWIIIKFQCVIVLLLRCIMWYGKRLAQAIAGEIHQDLQHIIGIPRKRGAFTDEVIGAGGSGVER